MLPFGYTYFTSGRGAGAAIIREKVLMLRCLLRLFLFACGMRYSRRRAWRRRRDWYD
jgi:hypothetical protein